MKLFFEGDSIIEQIKTQLVLHDRVSKAKLTHLFLTPIEAECLAAELDTDILGLDEALREVEGFEEVKLVIPMGGA